MDYLNNINTLFSDCFDKLKELIISVLAFFLEGAISQINPLSLLQIYKFKTYYF